MLSMPLIIKRLHYWTEAFHRDDTNDNDALIFFIVHSP